MDNNSISSINPSSDEQPQNRPEKYSPPKIDDEIIKSLDAGIFPVEAAESFAGTLEDYPLVESDGGWFNTQTGERNTAYDMLFARHRRIIDEMKGRGYIFLEENRIAKAQAWDLIVHWATVLQNVKEDRQGFAAGIEIGRANDVYAAEQILGSDATDSNSISPEELRLWANKVSGIAAPNVLAATRIRRHIETNYRFIPPTHRTP